MRLKSTYSNNGYTLVSIFDPAIDPEKSNIEEYRKTREIEHLVFKPGSVPTKFVFRNLPSAISYFLKAGSQGYNVSNNAFFQFAIERIENINEFCLSQNVEMTNDGLTVWEPEDLFKNDDISFKYCEHPELLFHWNVIQELGNIVQKKAFLMRGQKPDFRA